MSDSATGHRSFPRCMRVTGSWIHLVLSYPTSRLACIDGRKKNDAGKEVAKVVGASYERTVCH